MIYRSRQGRSPAGAASAAARAKAVRLQARMRFWEADDAVPAARTRRAAPAPRRRTR